MTCLRKHLALPAVLLLAAAPHAALAQAAAPAQPQAEAAYAPLMARFSGTNTVMLAPTPTLNINGYGTIEFWVAAKWTADPGYDPAVMAYTGPKGARFAFHISADARKFGVQAGPYYETVDFDFSDQKMHYVAITSVGATTTVMIDGEEQGVLGFGFGNDRPTSFSIGSAGSFSPFIGDIGQVRIWNEPIDPDVLVQYSWRPIISDGTDQHPDIDSLVGFSAFANPEIGGFLFKGDPGDQEAMTATFDDAADDADDKDLEPPEAAAATS